MSVLNNIYARIGIAVLAATFDYLKQHPEKIDALLEKLDIPGAILKKLGI